MVNYFSQFDNGIVKAIIRNYKRNLRHQKMFSLKSVLQKNEINILETFRTLIQPFEEIKTTLSKLRLIIELIKNGKLQNCKIRQEEFLHYNVENFLQETYILSLRITKYIRIFYRRGTSISKELKQIKISRLEKCISARLSNLINSRSHSVHERRTDSHQFMKLRIHTAIFNVHPDRVPPKSMLKEYNKTYANYRRRLVRVFAYYLKRIVRILNEVFKEIYHDSKSKKCPAYYYIINHTGNSNPTFEATDMNY